MVVNFLKLVYSIAGMGDNVAIFDGTKRLPPGTHCQSGGHSGVKAHGKHEKSQHPELHPGTTGVAPRPNRRLTVLYP